MRISRAAAVALALALALARTPAEERVAVDEVLATVNGEAVLQSAVDRLGEEFGGLESRADVLRQAVFRLALEQAARAAGTTIPDEKLNQVMAERVLRAGGADAYRARLARIDVTPDQDRIEIRDALVGEQYVNECIGLVPGSPYLRPHLARFLSITPKELQEHFRAHREEFTVGGRIAVGRAVVPKAKYPSAAEARAAAETLRAAAGEDGARLKAAAEAAVPGSYQSLEVKARTDPALRAEIRDYLASAQILAVSPVIETPGAFVLVTLEADEPARPVEFAAAQEAIERVLIQVKRGLARDKLAQELLREARVWPAWLAAPGPPSESAVAPEKSGP